SPVRNAQKRGGCCETRRWLNKWDRETAAMLRTLLVGRFLPPPAQSLGLLHCLFPSDKPNADQWGTRLKRDKCWFDSPATCSRFLRLDPKSISRARGRLHEQAPCRLAKWLRPSCYPTVCGRRRQTWMSARCCTLRPG